MTKIKDFMISKLNNFRDFLNDQFKACIDNGVIIPNPQIINDEINYYINNLNEFINIMTLMSKSNIDDSVKIFLLKYNIQLSDIINHIDYNKLRRYLEMFIEVIKN